MLHEGFLCSISKGAACDAGDRVVSWFGERSLEKEVTTHPSILSGYLPLGSRSLVGSSIYGAASGHDWWQPCTCFMKGHSRSLTELQDTPHPVLLGFLVLGDWHQERGSHTIRGKWSSGGGLLSDNKGRKNHNASWVIHYRNFLVFSLF